VDLPRFKSIDYDNFQRNAEARYQEFVRQPIKVEISPQVQQVQQRQSSADRPIPEVQPKIINVQMTNDLKINVADGKEGKQSIVNNTLQSLEEILRLVEGKNQ
jgi:hypothetical protein